MAIDDLTITPNHIVFSLDKHLRTARTGFVVMNRDGSNRHWLIKDTATRAPRLPMMTATDDAVSFTDIDVFSEFLDTHLRQIPIGGGSITQVSCSKAFKGARRATPARGDRLCASGPRVECFDRDLNEPMTTRDFVSTPETTAGCT